ncbi:MAG: aminoacetone oxidase family FAD-binding enzyme [Clostridiales bacterium]|nr:aminoacetone oxidase family FAD-binding enzyme [Clostridiales bacterium]
MHTLIIGAGAAGIAAAIAAAKSGQQVTVLDRNRKALKKVGVTGNGRGNLLNHGELRYFGDADFALEVMTQMPYENVRDFLQSAGISLVHEGDLVYPSSLLASVAVEALLAQANELGVRIHVNTSAKSAIKTGETFHVTAVQSKFGKEKPKASGKMKKGALLEEKEVHYAADRLIVAVGGAAAPAHGTDGTGYDLLTTFGHRLTPICPALCALLTDERPIGGLAGQRVRAALTLKSKDDQILAQSKGEALFAQDGVSGIAAMQLARFVQKNAVLTLDMSETLMGDAAETMKLHEWLSRRTAQKKNAPIASLFAGSISAPLSRAILAASGIRDTAQKVASLTATDLEQLEKAITAFTVKVKGTRDFEAAQVTAGGIQTIDFNPQTMQSKLVDGLYAVGEVLNVDGDCGGYNLMFAFASGLLAGEGTGIREEHGER